MLSRRLDGAQVQHACIGTANGACKQSSRQIMPHQAWGGGELWKQHLVQYRMHACNEVMPAPVQEVNYLDCSFLTNHHTNHTPINTYRVYLPIMQINSPSCLKTAS